MTESSKVEAGVMSTWVLKGTGREQQVEKAKARALSPSGALGQQ